MNGHTVGWLAVAGFATGLLVGKIALTYGMFSPF